MINNTPYSARRGLAAPLGLPLRQPLPTTFEYGQLEDVTGECEEEADPHPPTPPSRAANPFPELTDYAFQHGPLRRQSVATFSTHQQPPALLHGAVGAPNGTGPARRPQFRTLFLQAPMSGGEMVSPRALAQLVPRVRRMPPPRAQIITHNLQLCPQVNTNPQYRRALVALVHISPLMGTTMALHLTYKMCHPNQFAYNHSKNPRRVLTKPSEGKLNNGYDNEDSDYVLYVNDVLGVQEGKKYLVLDIYGLGTFGQVVKCQNLHNKEIVAVKVIKSKPAYLNQLLTEVLILEVINTKVDPHNQHHFLRLKDKFIHRNHLCIVFELLGLNLYELLKQNQFHGLLLKLVQLFAYQMLDSLACLKNHRIIHCDLKPENILLCAPNKPFIKIIDFGSSCYENQTVYTYLQSRFYRLPEVILGLPYNAAIDMWSLGCIVAELYLGLPLFPGTSEYNQLCRIVNMCGMPPLYMLEMGKNSWNFVNKLPLLKDPTPERSDTPMLEVPLPLPASSPLVPFRYQLKSMSQYLLERGVVEKPSKNYFQHDTLDDIILNYNIHSLQSRSLLQPPPDPTTVLSERELGERRQLIDFLKGCLTLNPLERLTPQQAIQHPFVGGQGLQRIVERAAPPPASAGAFPKQLTRSLMTFYQ